MKLLIAKIIVYSVFLFMAGSGVYAVLGDPKGGLVMLITTLVAIFIWACSVLITAEVERGK